MADVDLKDYQTRAEVAQLLGISAETLRLMEQRGEGPTVVRFSPRKSLYRNTDLIRYLKARTVGGAA